MENNDDELKIKKCEVYDKYFNSFEINFSVAIFLLFCGLGSFLLDIINTFNSNIYIALFAAACSIVIIFIIYKLANDKKSFNKEIKAFSKANALREMPHVKEEEK